jgi:uncharacterized protein (DUF302 family)
MSSYAFGKTVDLRFETAIERIASALVREGFGIVSDIDVARRLKAKLGVDMPRYRILAACHSATASQALEAEPEIGAMVPCNIVIRESEDGKTRLDFVDPLATLGLSDRPEVRELATSLRAHMEAALARV